MSDTTQAWTHRTARKCLALRLVPAFLLVPSLLFAKGPTPDQLKEIRQAELLGRAIYAQDAAVSGASDAFLAAVDPAGRRDVIGWVASGDPNDLKVSFVAEVDGKYYGLYQVEVKEGRVGPVAVLDPPAGLTDPELGMFTARQLALRSMPKDCPGQYNTVVLPGALAKSEGWLVYLLAASADADKVPVGGHFRAHVSVDGGHLVSLEPLSKSCLTLTRSSETVALYMTQVLTDTPIETHVFLNLLYGGDFYVATESSVWGISDGTIRYLGRNKKGK